MFQVPIFRVCPVDRRGFGNAVSLWLSLPCIMVSLLGESHSSSRRKGCCENFVVNVLVTVWFFWGEVVSLTPNPQPGRPGTGLLSDLYLLTHLAWLDMLGAKARAGIALWVTKGLIKVAIHGRG